MNIQQFLWIAYCKQPVSASTTDPYQSGPAENPPRNKPGKLRRGKNILVRQNSICEGGLYSSFANFSKCVTGWVCMTWLCPLDMCVATNQVRRPACKTNLPRVRWQVPGSRGSFRFLPFGQGHLGIRNWHSPSWNYLSPHRSFNF